VFDGDGRIEPGDPSQNVDPKWTYADGLRRLPRELARGLRVRRGAAVVRLARQDDGFRLFDQAGEALAETRAVLLTPPAPVTAALVAASELPEGARAALLAELGRVAYRRCLSFALGYQARLRPRPWYALVNTDRRHPVSWLAYEHLKPGRASAGQQVVIAQMAAAWSLERWRQGRAAATAELIELLGTLLGENLRDPRWSDRAAWPYALPDGRADPAVLDAALPGLFFAGDYTAGQGRVHLALEEGWRAASALAVSLAP
jgi:renalase